MNRHNFKFTISDDTIRTMNRKQYKATTHYLRWLARYVQQKIDWDKFEKRLSDALALGRHEVFCGDLLL